MTSLRWLLVIAIGCSPSTADQPDAGTDATTETSPERSGTRLKRRGYDLEGTRAFRRIFDSARNETCAVSEWTDGARYCTPFEATGYVVFADAGCTTPVGLGHVRCPGTAPSYFADFASSTCGESAVSKLFERGAERSGTQYYRIFDGACSSPLTMSSEEQLFTLGAEVPPSAFVRVTASVVGTHRLRQVYDESDDGLRVATRVHDSALAQECLFQDDVARTSWQCLPRAHATIGYYADASCTSFAGAIHGTCEVPPYLLHNTAPGCSLPTYTAFRTGAALGSTIYDPVGGVCMPHDLGDDVRVVAAGEAVDLAAPTRVELGESDRIKRLHASAEGDAFSMQTLTDKVKQTDCIVTTAGDGVLRCLPIGNFVQHYFRDAACTQPIDAVRVYRGQAGCEVPPKPKFANRAVPGSTGCDFRYEIRLVGAEITAPLYTNYGSCEQLSSPASFYELGVVIPPSEFAAATLITEP
jgi:hypothetical protein